MSDRQLLDLVEGSIDRDGLIGLVQELVRTPSTQTDRFESDPEILSYISGPVKRLLEERGVGDVMIDDMGNLICRIGRANSGRRVLFLGYAMTHPASGMDEPFSGEIVQGEQFGLTGPCVWGRGSAEQKGALAGMIAAFGLLSKQWERLEGEAILIVSTAGETGRHDSVKHVFAGQDVTADMGVVGIGTESRICIRNKGRIDLLVDVEGRSCHSSTPWDGVSAIEGARLVLNRLSGLRLDGEHPELGRATLTPTSIKSFPDATHTVQSLCQIVLDRRLLPGDSPDAAMEEVISTIGDLSPCKVRVQKGPFMYPSEASESSAVVQGLRSVFQRVTGREAEVFSMHGAIDAGYLNHRGVPAVMFGPGDASFWHTDHEVVPVDEVVDAARSYALLALEYLSEQTS